jgi:hypothetical protein
MIPEARPFYGTIYAAALLRIRKDGRRTLSKAAVLFLKSSALPHQEKA